MEWTVWPEAQDRPHVESPVESLWVYFIENKSPTGQWFGLFKFTWENKDGPSWRGRVWNIEETSLQERRQKHSINMCFSLLWEQACQCEKQVLEDIEGVEYKIEIVIRHSIKSMQNYTPYIEPAGNVRNTQLQKVLKFKVGSRVLLTVNLNTNDLLTNGCLGTVVGVQLGDNEEVNEVHAAFDNPEAGKETFQKFPHLSQIYGRKVVPIKKYAQGFKIGRQGSANESEATAYQVPLKLAAAVTCHRVSKHTKYLDNNIFILRL